ncbi:LmbE family N-acetylglucosaminyl deacetylase [Dysgonomonadaceae bacterium PH5-43]|nr:LmbE family N-acetylglucosaminyl deacetylase [Dysgonomonadaceae bacterium PH5-43]
MVNNLKNIYRYLRVLTIRFCAWLFAKKGLGDFKSILILAPHPDDEVFGCAGLIQYYQKRGCKVHIAILTDGDAAYPESLISKKELAQQRLSLTHKAAKILSVNVDNITYLHWKDGEIDKFADYEGLMQIVNDIRPEAMFSTHSFEGWSDHIATAQLADRIVRDFMEFNIRNFKYCVWLWYSMPYSQILKLNWKNSKLFKLTKEEYNTKLAAINEYIEPLTDFGKSYSGELPSVFVKANKWNKELYFEAK